MRVIATHHSNFLHRKQIFSNLIIHTFKIDNFDCNISVVFELFGCIKNEVPA